MFYGLIETNRSGWGIASCRVCAGQFEDNLSFDMLSYNGNYFLTEYYPTMEGAREALDDLLDELEVI